MTTDTKIMQQRADFSYLIIVVMTVKERFLSEDHAGEHAAQTPHVQAVVIHLQITEGVRRLEQYKQILSSLILEIQSITLTKWCTGALPGSLPAVQVL